MEELPQFGVARRGEETYEGGGWRFRSEGHGCCEVLEAETRILSQVGLQFVSSCGVRQATAQHVQMYILWKARVAMVHAVR
eukprot:5656083-Pyramimonas_sp.AAC.1